MGGERAERCLRLQAATERTVLFLELSTALTLFTLDALPFSQRQHLLVFHAKLPAVQLEVVHRIDDRGGLLGRGEICESQAPEYTIVKMVVEGIGQWQPQICHERYKLLLLYCERNVLNDDSGGDEFFVDVVSEAGVQHGPIAVVETGKGKGGQALGRVVHPSLVLSVIILRDAPGLLTEGRALRPPRCCDFMRAVVAPPSDPMPFCEKAFVFQPAGAPMS